MNILLYLQELTKSGGGVFQYSMALMNILQHESEHQYFLFISEDYSEIKEYCKKENFHIIEKKYLITSPGHLRFLYLKQLINKILSNHNMPFRLKINTRL